MSGFALALISAFWLGILTSISPCPLATNIAAISFVSRKVASPLSVLVAGVFYTLGRAVCYAVLGVLLVRSLLAAPLLSHWLQKYMNMLLGPVLIIAGMFLLELLTFGFSSTLINEKTRAKISAHGLWSAFPLGVLFALSFCPVSAALFFGSLIPFSLQQQSGVVLPAVYGVATGLPVLASSVLLAAGTQRLAKVFEKLQSAELWARRITGVIFIAVGLYFSLVHVFNVL